ncbi:acyl-CoA thioesterase [Sediminitomix flava]|uniref:Acyl-CoA hydrolase n=1 Tax=Sediminitomix flava TaxID=379075 RepID=A0A315ZDB7_SEDFL|nr:acyl-CoA thioesterase [Sediminitomix flava]PWJ43113.1 acyl-CoA hydrolase [Sediminitomix flava]
MTKQQKLASESKVVTNQIVLPNETNPLNKLMGGELLHQMDVTAAIAAQRHSNSIVVTASVDNVSFNHPIGLGNIVTLEAQVTRSFTSSMEVYIKVSSEDITTGIKQMTNEAYLTFVAIDGKGNKVQVPQLVPETEQEKDKFASALRRRQLRLILAGKMKPENAEELQAIFINREK